MNFLLIILLLSLLLSLKYELQFKRSALFCDVTLRRLIDCYRHQYSETNVMHFLFSLLGIKSLYMFGALLAHLQEALHNRHLVYCVRVMSFGFTRIGGELVQPTDIRRTQYT
jgi:hypothetical protein